MLRIYFLTLIVFDVLKSTTVIAFLIEQNQFLHPCSTNSLFGLFGLKSNPILGPIQSQSLQYIYIYMVSLSQTNGLPPLPSPFSLQISPLSVATSLSLFFLFLLFSFYFSVLVCLMVSVFWFWDWCFGVSCGGFQWQRWRISGG